jgi:hypothetical protein
MAGYNFPPHEEALRMKLFAPLASFAMLALLGGSAFAAPSTPDTMPSPTLHNMITVNLGAQNGSGETGQATLTQDGGDVVVTILMNKADLPDQPAHIHTGSCAKLDPAPKYGLNNLVRGTSTTTLKARTLASLETGGFAINVHKSTTDIPDYVACGDIPKI